MASGEDPMAEAAGVEMAPPSPERKADKKQVDETGDETGAGAVSATSITDVNVEEVSAKETIASLRSELEHTTAQLARVTKERDYFKRKALWVTNEDQRILSEVITSTDNWWELTWLLLHEPIRNSLLEMQELVINTPGFDPVQFPWKVTNFFIFFNKCFAPYVRRHHEAEEKVYFPWIQSKAEIPQVMQDEHKSGHGVINLLKDIETSEAEYKKLTASSPAKPPTNEELYDWRNRLTTRLQVLADCLREHMKEEEAFFPALVKEHFTKKEEDAIVERMGSAQLAHVELPMVVMHMDQWAGPAIKTAFLQRLSYPARQTLSQYWLPTFKKTLWNMLESLALEEPPPTTYVPLLSAPVLIASSPVLLLCSIQ